MRSAFLMVLAYCAVFFLVLLLGGLPAAFVWALAVPVVFVVRLVVLRFLLLVISNVGGGA
jgi:hypothetical protein